MRRGPSGNQSFLQAAILVQVHDIVEITLMSSSNKQDGHSLPSRQTLNEWRQHRAVICE